MSTSATSSKSIGELNLGPDVSIPVFEAHDPLRLPMQRLLLNLEDPIVFSDLTWMAKKWQREYRSWRGETWGWLTRSISVLMSPHSVAGHVSPLPSWLLFSSAGLYICIFTSTTIRIHLDA